ncbi:MAG: hypothetical protein WC384_06175 [Prolixibacteraceae bacterium]|jgi:hypothetical protein
MKNKIIIFIFLSLLSFSDYAQKNAGFGCFTDRDVYVSGETLLAKIFTPEDNPSRIVHIDLINRNGTRITGASMKINDNQANGFLLLPDSLSTGTYLLWAYEKNTASRVKVIREIWISNRFNGIEKTSQMNRVVASQKIQDKASDLVKIEGIKTEYQTKEPVSATISIDEKLRKDIDGKLLVSVAQTYPSFEPASFPWKTEEVGLEMTEDKGVILSGTVIDKNTKEPVAGITVFLTIPDSIPGFQYYKTQNDGHFYFLLDKYQGPVQAVIQCFSNKPEQRLKISLEDHLPKAGDIPQFRSENIPEDFKNSISVDVDAFTFQKIFGQDKILKQEPPVRKKEAYPYYGAPTKTVDPQLFIDLPDFNEISKELLPGVKFRNYNNEPSIQILSPQMHAYFTDPPLILIDGIPVRDLNIIKNMGSTDIDRIDISQNERYYGDLKFEGVVAIHTTTHNYSHISESDQLIRLNLETIQVPATFAPLVETEPNIPDLRQVFYWNPGFDPSQSLTINTKTSSIKGHFKLVVRGRLKDGSFMYSEKQFEVQ